MIVQKNKFWIGLFLLIGLFAASCKPIRKQDVLMLYPNWAEGIAITHLAKVALEENGYVVVTKRLEPGPIFAALSRGDADIYMDAWLPHTHKDYWNRFGKRLEKLGTVFDDGITGLVVPSYVSINSIEELNANRDRFDGKIYGIASGAGINTNTEKAIKEYGLEYQQLSSSETSMITALKKAISNKEWIVITGWKPHFIWSKFDLKPLDDPKNVYPTDQICVVGRKGFSQDNPVLAAFFEKFNLNESMLNELMTEVGKDRDPGIGASRFYQKYKETINSWIEPKR